MMIKMGAKSTPWGPEQQNLRACQYYCTSRRAQLSRPPHCTTKHTPLWYKPLTLKVLKTSKSFLAAKAPTRLRRVSHALQDVQLHGLRQGGQDLGVDGGDVTPHLGHERGCDAAPAVVVVVVVVIFVVALILVAVGTTAVGDAGAGGQLAGCSLWGEMMTDAQRGVEVTGNRLDVGGLVMVG